MKVGDLRELVRFSDGLSFLYLEHAVLEQEARSVAAFTSEGRISLPVASLGTLMLGPGTRITHAAVRNLADGGCVVAWTGAEGLRFYAAGQEKTRSSAGLEAQCLAWADPERRQSVVRRLYEQRFDDPLPADLTLQQIRGREGARVRDGYRDCAERFGVEWRGRRYSAGDWTSADPVNRALSATNAALYAVALAAVHSLGYSPALGFIHTGKQLSFIYDIADVFKMDTSVPAAFAAASEGEQKVESRARELFRRRASEVRLLDRLPRLLAALFAGATPGPDEFDRVSADPASLWDPEGNVPGGRLHDADES